LKLFGFLNFTLNNIMRKIFLFLSIFTSIFNVDAQNDYKDEYQSLYKNLYEGAIPNSKVADNKQKTEVNANKHVFTTEISVPTIARFDPSEKLKNGTTVIICPGGGYWGTADKHEGTDVAKVFNSWGVTAFVLRYRMPDARTSIDPSVSALQDAQQAIRWVRKNAKTWGLDEKKIGIMGYSAGGHLAATATTHFQANADPSVSDGVSVRPDFSMLIYAVISLKPELAHGGSRDKLLGENAPFEKIYAFSNEEQVTSETPPTFLVHAADDGAVPVGNSIEFYQKCIKNKVPAEMHLYPKGGHGFGMDNKTTNDKWMERLQNWLDSLGLLKK
jgi:acetyl esterase/lipase